MAEERNPRQERQSTRKKKKGNGFVTALKVLGTLFTIGVLTAGMLVFLFLTYVNTTLAASTDNFNVEVTDYEMVLSSIIYYEDKDTGEWKELNTLYKEENRIWVDYEDMPEHLWRALIAIEDERFETHRGVDVKRTAGAVVNMFLGMKNTFGGSTITQQLIKNLTGEKEGTVKRKVTEICRALQFEKNYSKEEILELYLNRVYFGQMCNGVGSASKVYFGKEAKDLTLAEAASIIGITNNPSQYDPFISEWTRGQNKERQELILGKMLELEMISQEEYDAAVAQELVFTTELQRQEAAEEEAAEAKKSNKYYSYFVDAVIEDCIKALMEEFGWNYDTAETKLYNSGYRIYTTVDMEIQEIAESVYEDIENINYTSSSGQQLQSAITIMDPYTGNVVAMVGGVGEKTGSRVLNRATSLRQCGSAIKPISTYAPALDAGTISNASSIDDYPVRDVGGRAWPVNSHVGYDGLVSLRKAVASSLNPCAVRVNEALGVANSYTFLESNLGISTLVSDDLNSASLALGGLTKGVSTEEVCAAYCTFPNNGVYNEPRLFTKITDADGNIIIDNQPDSWVAMKDTTAYFINELLKAVITEGTAGRAAISGMTVAGKTGTTSNNFDRYFVGYTPYYCAAVWTGYDINEKITASGNPSITMWQKVMSKIHENLENKGFSKPSSGFTTVNVCADSGLLATEACALDIRGSRVKSMTVATGTAPTQECNLHVTIEYCNEGQCLAGEFCPVESVATKAVLDYTREDILNVTHDVPADYIYTLEGIGVSAEGEGGTDIDSETGTPGTTGCTVHTAAPEIPDIDDPTVGPDDPLVNPDDPAAGGADTGATITDWWNTLIGGGDTA